MKKPKPRPRPSWRPCPWDADTACYRRKCEGCEKRKDEMEVRQT